jgi:hypothetical protein
MSDLAADSEVRRVCHIVGGEFAEGAEGSERSDIHDGVPIRRPDRQQGRRCPNLNAGQEAQDSMLESLRSSEGGRRDVMNVIIRVALKSTPDPRALPTTHGYEFISPVIPSGPDSWSYLIEESQTS